MKTEIERLQRRLDELKNEAEFIRKVEQLATVYGYSVVISPDGGDPKGFRGKVININSMENRKVVESMYGLKGKICPA
jgi:hypothetical protein